MKKLLLILACVLGITCCTHREIAYPNTHKGTFRAYTSQLQAKNIIHEACTKAKWKILSENNSQFKVQGSRRGYEYTAIIKYTKTNYTILFNRIDQDNGNIHIAYAVYDDSAAKLKKTIQKYAGAY